MATLKKQIYYLIYRNILIKKRNKNQTFQEIFIPLIFCINLITIKYSIPNQTYDAIPSFPTYSLDEGYYYPNSSVPLGFAPNTSENAAIMAAAAAKLNITASPSAIPFETEEDLLSAYLSEDNPAPIQTGIIFSDDFPGNLSYKIRRPYGAAPGAGLKASSDQCRNINPAPGLAGYGCPANQYLYSGFLTIQVAMDHAIATVINSKMDLPYPTISFQMFPKGEYEVGVETVKLVSSLYYIIMFTPFIAILLSSLVGEKEKKIKECMKIMGLKETAFWVAWAVTYQVIIAVASIFIVALSYAIGIFRKGNPFLIYLNFFFYGSSIVTISFMLTPFFNKGLTAGAAGSFFTLLISLAYIPLGLIEGIAPAIQWAMCLFAPISMALAMDKAVSYELLYGGLTFQTFGLGDFPAYACLVMLIVDTILYLTLAIYFENVVPSEYGLRKPLLFFLKPSYWSPGKSVSDKTHLLSDTNGSVNTNDEGGDVEAVHADVRQRDGIKIQNLEKIFPGSKRSGKPDVKAVDGISLDIYEGQITCLLGHNGAGKSTLINLLTGLMNANSGSATVYGHNIRNPIEMDTIRTIMGVCSQQNTLFDFLSPTEHLKVYAGLKGIPDEEIDGMVQKTLKDIDLDKQAATFAKDLSGGQQRKLCVGMAMIGNPKVLFLDEPSSGMDPYSRRKLWSLLKKQREGRVTLFTTHFMDEADILGDRKAIMSKGTLRCCGSSLFLKNRFGIGYHLGMVVEQNCAVDPITSLVQSHVADAGVDRAHGMELHYTLPLNDVSNFAGLFEALENKDDTGVSSTAMALGIQSYGISMTTLEEVFLKIGEEAEEEDDATDGSKKEKKGGKNKTNDQGFGTFVNDSSATSTPSTSIQDGAYNNSGITLEEVDEPQHTAAVQIEDATLDSTKLATNPIVTTSGAQIKAMCRILFLINIRMPFLYINRIIFPSIYMILGVLLSTLISFGGSDQSNPVARTLEPSLYLATVDEIVTNQKTSLLYKDSLPADQNISELVSEFSSLDISSEPQSNLSELFSVAPHSAALDVVNIGTGLQYTALYNDSTVHALPITLSVMSNAFYRLMDGLTPDQQITATNHPLPGTDIQVGFTSGFFFVIFFGMAVIGIPAGFAIFVIRERQIKVVSQLRVSGVEMWRFWLAHFLIDMFQFALPFIVGIIIIAAFRMPSFTQPGAMFMFILFMLMYMPLTTMFHYCVSFAFKDYETASGILPILILYACLFMLAPLLLMDLLVSTTVAGIIHLFICIVFPPYSVLGALYFIDKVYQQALVFNVVDKLTFGDYFTMDYFIFPTILVMIIPMIGYFFMLRYLEIRSKGGDTRDTCPGGSARKPMRASKVNNDKIEGEDSDVIAERVKVQQIFEEDKNCSVAIDSLRREFVKRIESGGCCQKQTVEEKTKVAVRNLSFAVNQGEVMGLLGPNGAGKTTALNTVIAEHEPTKGQIRVAGHDITSSLNEAFEAMGYCPQVDPLYPDVTLREHLEVYAAIKGIHASDIKNVTEQYMEALYISEHADKRSQHLSGGTKRKLCFAMSMLGDPQVVLMDEPSTGMDPKSKRFLWNTISASFQDKRGAILTTHSMEEADAVCSRVGIMVLGQLKCLGTTQHLKDKYGGGYVLEVKLQLHGQGALEERIEALHNYVRSILHDAEVSENFGERITYKIPKKSVASLSTVFAAMEKGKDTLGVEEYSFSQSTLEQVFIEFARIQEESDEIDEADKHMIGRTKRPEYDRSVSVRSLPRPQSELNGGASSEPC
ncbi:cholesterol transporter ABCA5-like [Amphiura filiformis]|uniref:cholesterol transporter ABCA5-like n=1 Tax=Amphiura filiformis TaxID=82378 RepID=UPI003B21843B